MRTVWVGTGETRLCSFVSEDHRYEPMVKSGGAQRESDGVVVPQVAVSNAVRGKGPDFGHASGGGKHGGMAGIARSNHPGGQSRPVVLHRLGPVGTVRELRRKLWAAAKQSEGRCFHALYDRICRSDVLWEAWERVRANRGAAGVDRVTLAVVEDYGVGRMLEELARDLRAGVYRPSPVRRVEIVRREALCCIPNTVGRNLEECFWVQWLTLIRKVYGNSSMPGNQRPLKASQVGCCGTRVISVKAGLLEVQSSDGEHPHPSERRVKPVPHPASTWDVGRGNLQSVGDAQRGHSRR